MRHAPLWVLSCICDAFYEVAFHFLETIFFRNIVLTGASHSEGTQQNQRGFLQAALTCNNLDNRKEIGLKQTSRPKPGLLSGLGAKGSQPDDLA